MRKTFTYQKKRKSWVDSDTTYKHIIDIKQIPSDGTEPRDAEWNNKEKRRYRLRFSMGGEPWSTWRNNTKRVQCRSGHNRSESTADEIQRKLSVEKK